MDRQFVVGDIVQDGTFVSLIKEIESGAVVLEKNHVVEMKSLSPVRINGGFDRGIVLRCKPFFRASIVSSNSRSYPHKISKPYIEDYIDDNISIASIVENNRMKYIHELQDWLVNNSPDFYLTTII